MWNAWRCELPISNMANGGNCTGYVKQVILLPNCTHFYVISATVPCEAELRIHSCCILTMSKKIGGFCNFYRLNFCLES